MASQSKGIYDANQSIRSQTTAGNFKDSPGPGAYDSMYESTRGASMAGKFDGKASYSIGPGEYETQKGLGTNGSSQMKVAIDSHQEKGRTSINNNKDFDNTNTLSSTQRESNPQKNYGYGISPFSKGQSSGSGQLSASKLNGKGSSKGVRISETTQETPGPGSYDTTTINKDRRDHLN